MSDVPMSPTAVFLKPNPTRATSLRVGALASGLIKRMAYGGFKVLVDL
jgi:hypothetical protein